MAIQLDEPEVQARAERLASLKRVSVQQLRTKAQRRADIEVYLAGVHAQRNASAPSREEIEAEMYDENGLPR